MGKKFVLRIKPVGDTNTEEYSTNKVGGIAKFGKTKAEATVRQKRLRQKSHQLNDAVAWCRKHNKTGYQAIKTGKYPLIKSYKTINTRLSGKVVTDQERKSTTILLPSEEKAIVEYIKNRNRSYQALNKKSLTALILDILKIRRHFNKTVPRGRRTTPLSDNAKQALAMNKLSRSFWLRWDTKFQDICKKRQGTISTKRGMNCTREMAEAHLDELAEELINANIFTNSKQLAPGVWEGDIDLSRILNHDETPQFINYGVDGGPSGLVYAGRGEEAKKMINENRECVTINPVITLSGKVLMCQVIFAGKGVMSSMAPKEAVENIPNLLVSVTESGMQDHKSMLSSYKVLHKCLLKEEVVLPVVTMSDGHSSRYNYDVLSFLTDQSMKLFLGPPDSTSVTQTLDQINRNLHYHYTTTRDDLFTAFSTINRCSFMKILGRMWSEWTTPELIRKAAKRVGIASNGLNVNWMQQDKFERAALLRHEGSATAPLSSSVSTSSKSQAVNPTPLSSTNGESSSVYETRSWRNLSDTSTPPLSDTPTPTISLTSPSTAIATSSKSPCQNGASRKNSASPYPNIPSPDKADRYTAAWYKAKLKYANDALGHEQSMNLSNIPGLMSIKTASHVSEPKKNVKITNVCGSVEGREILKLVKQVQDNKDLKEQKKQDKMNEKKNQQSMFAMCFDKCVCAEEICRAIKLRKCPSCGNVQRSVCSKVSCRINDQKPLMILPAAAKLSKKRKGSDTSDDESTDERKAGKKVTRKKQKLIKYFKN